MEAIGFVEAKRQHGSVLASAEKRALIWLAERMPRAVMPDYLTGIGFAAMLLAGASYVYARWSPAGLWLVIACLVINWVGDSLDGTLARVRRQQRPRYGFYVDHIIDAFGTFVLFLGMAASGYLSWQVAAGILVVYFMVCIEVYLATYTVGTFHLSFSGFGPTELRIVIAIGNLALLTGHKFANVLGAQYRMFDVGGVVAIIGLTVALVVSSIRHTRMLYMQERLP